MTDDGLAVGARLSFLAFPTMNSDTSTFSFSQKPNKYSRCGCSKMAGKVETHLGSTNSISTNSLHDVSLLEPLETPSGQTNSAGSNPSSPPQTSTNSSSTPPPSGITMLIVGAGFAGLACAIEGVRKGHDVLVLERWAGPGTGNNNQLGEWHLCIYFWRFSGWKGAWRRLAGDLDGRRVGVWTFSCLTRLDASGLD
ncbi:hypothetical protein BDQ12DRAFT_63400 [Crucibulum laeve]|uniref:FAD dependent oxidoreductase domain-containing protein n=1 Tax=Crucibulum laeve TaxID=68775 RepID=A0A5C3M328_9AGAR|nr:hypothetical protein BDQ12DRAFT_63400 [Crucibulum laeve]